MFQDAQQNMGRIPMNPDRRGFYSHEEDDVRTHTSTRSIRPKHQTYQTTPREIVEYTYRRRESQDMILDDELRRRGNRQPVTEDDPHLSSERAYALPRAKMIAKKMPAKRRLTRRQAVYALGAAALACVVGGAYLKSEIDNINARMSKGDYDFTAGRYTDIAGNSSQTIELYAFLQADYRVRFVQISASDSSKSHVIETSPVIMDTPLSSITLSLDVQEQGNNTVCTISMNGQTSASWSYVYNPKTGFFA